MSKADWIRAQYGASTQKNIPLFVSALNTQALVNNPVPQKQIPKPLNMIEFSSQLAPADRRLLQKEGSYNSLLINIDKRDMPAAQADIQNLMTTPALSLQAVGVLQKALTAIAETIPDPNWSPKVMLSPSELAGFGLILTTDVQEALK